MSDFVERVYRAHGEAVFRYLVRMSGDPDVAADVLQDTFHTLLRRPPPDQSRPRAWLFRVATNRLRDVQRSVRRRSVAARRLEPERTQSGPPPSPERTAIQADAREEAERLLAALDPRDRAILLMRQEGFTHREIAEAVGTTTGSIGTMIARALDRAVRAHGTAGRTT